MLKNPRSPKTPIKSRKYVESSLIKAHKKNLKCPQKVYSKQYTPKEANSKKISKRGSLRIQRPICSNKSE